MDPRSVGVVVTSAKSLKSHEANQRRLLDWLHANPRAKPQDIAYSTTARNVHHPIRFACAVSSVQQLIGELESDLESGSLNHTAQTNPLQKPAVVFVFTGQGSHYAGMGGELYHSNPIVRETVDMCARIGGEHGFPPFVDIITDEATLGTSQKDALKIQLAVVTLEIALATFWRRVCVEPSLVIGHSLGEYAALHVAGVLSIADALHLVGQRARLISQMCEPGTCAMLAVSTPVATVQQHLETMALGGRSSCAVACINSPNATVVSGVADDLVQLKAAMSAKGIRSKMLAVPYGFHSFQVEPVLGDFSALAAGVTYSRPKIPVASTLLSSVVDSPGVFNPDYLVRQTRQPVDFVGALQAALHKFPDPIWLEIGPSRVCGAFVRETLAAQLLPSSRILSTLEAETGPWASVAKCLASLYKNGIDVDWLGIHQPYERGLKLLTLPSYAWDLKDYWVVYSEKKNDLASENIPAMEKQMLYTCAQWLESKPAHSITFKASLAEPGFKALIDGHQMRGIAICPGSAFSEAGLIAAKYALQAKGLYSGLESTSLALHNMLLRRPLTTTLVGPRGALLTKAVVEPHGAVLVTFRAVSLAQNGSYDLGTCVVTAYDLVRLQARWDRTSYYIKTRMDEVIQHAKDGCGHRMQCSLFYQLFSRTVDYQTEDYKCVREAFISQDFEEAAARIVLKEHPQGTHFVASPYWGEGLAHLAGFLANHHPGRSATGTTTMMMDSFETCEQTAAFQPGKSYFAYARICRREENTVVCEVIVFDNTDKMVMQCMGLCFHQVNNSFLDTLRPGQESKATTTVTTTPITRNNLQGKDHRTLKKYSPWPINSYSQNGGEPAEHSKAGERPYIGYQVMETQTTRNPVDHKTTEEEEQQNRSSSAKVLQTILESIAKETGLDIVELTDDTVLTELGVDSIMAIEITALVKEASEYDLLPSFMMEYPTIGHLRRAFGSSRESPRSHEVPIQHADTLSRTFDSSSQSPSESAAALTPPCQPQCVPDQIPAALSVDRTEDSSPLPKTRIVLLHGRRPKPEQMKLYLVADGCGTVSNYLPLLVHKYSMPIYGIDSPFFQCPSRLSSHIGIPGVAERMVKTLVDFQPDGPLVLGGYSGGAHIAYEMCRQLAVAGRKVDGLLLIDMRCPLPKTTVAPEQATPLHSELAWLLTQHAFTLDSGGAFNPNANASRHLEALFACVADYHPPPLPAAMGCPTALIWCEKGMIGRLEKHPDLLQKIVDHGLPTKPYPGFMEDPKLGHVMWGMVNKTEADMGPNGWDRYVDGGGEDERDNMLCMSVNADHSDIMHSTHSRQTFAAIEKALAFFLERWKG